MAIEESKQKWLSRNRPPRVHITYDVEKLGSIEKKEIPFVMGILADLSGTARTAPRTDLPKLTERRFVQIDRDNFDEVFRKARPRVELPAIQGAGGKTVAIDFDEFDDFEPVRVIEKVDHLRKLYDTRQKLSELLAKLDGNDDLGPLLDAIAAEKDQQASLLSEYQALNAASAQAAAPPAPAALDAPADTPPDAPGGAPSDAS